MISWTNFFGKNKKTAVFLYSPNYQFSGSTVMRGRQLSEIAERTLGGYEIRYAPIDIFFKKSILFFTKGAIASCNVERLRSFRRNKNTIIFDPVDSIIPNEKIEYADIIIAASRLASVEYKKRYQNKKIFLIDHHVDLRINSIDSSYIEAREFKIGYFGELFNTLMTPKIQKEVDFIRVNTAEQNTDWMKKLPKYSMHYAIRSRQEFDDLKPATKVFTAAYCCANILIQDSETEAVSWLGKDYPYLVKGPVNETAVIEAIYKGKKSFGSEEWLLGLETMNRIKKAASEDSMGKQLNDLMRLAEKSLVK